MATSPKWKSQITIWSDFNPNQVELSRLAFEAESGDAICTDYETSYVEDPDSDPSFVEEASEFFFTDDEDDD